MTPTELIQQGLALTGDEVRFRALVWRWIPEAIDLYQETNRWEYSLADLAFRGRDMAGDSHWMRFLALIYRHDCMDELATWHDTLLWLASKECTAYHWVLAACLALEMQQQKGA
jgi:hypothetical protein